MKHPLPEVGLRNRTYAFETWNLDPP